MIKRGTNGTRHLLDMMREGLMGRDQGLQINRNEIISISVSVWPFISISVRFFRFSAQD